MFRVFGLIVLIIASLIVALPLLFAAGRRMREWWRAIPEDFPPEPEPEDDDDGPDGPNDGEPLPVDKAEPESKQTEEEKAA